MKILIADDEAVCRRLLRDALVRLGHEVIEVADGISAIAALEKPDAPSLAIVDWEMPNLDGLAVCESLRRSPGHYVYVILLTARDEPGDIIRALDSGADDFLTKPLNIAELRARLRSGERVVALQDDLLRSQEILKHQAEHDQLTGLWNRGRILDQLSRELKRNRREGGSLTIIIADVDHFKSINDTHGHGVGDKILWHLGQKLLSTLRASDTVGRYGGEEFLFVLPHADMHGGREVAERVRATVADQPLIDARPDLLVTVSLGAACTDASGPDAATLVEAADRALYQAKAHGRNRVSSS